MSLAPWLLTPLSRSLYTHIPAFSGESEKTSLPPGGGVNNMRGSGADFIWSQSCVIVDDRSSALELQERWGASLCVCDVCEA